MSQLMRLAALLAIASLALRADAQRPSRRPPDDRSKPADNMPWNFFEESAAERAALEQVEVSEREERQIGDAGVEDLLASYRSRRIRVAERGADVDYLAALVSEIHPRMKHADRYPKIRIIVADTNDRDARAFPGGTIVVTTGMIDFAESEAALVAMLGHELSHIDHGHQLRMARAAKFAQGGWDVRGWDASGGGPQTMQQQITMMSRNFAKPFSAEDEAIADRDGATWAFELGYDPGEFAEVFQRFERRNPRGISGVPNFLRTHPYNADRHAEISGHADDLRRRRPLDELYIGRANLARRVPKSVRSFDE